jgi:superfamily I DNA/RNA helicase
MDIINKRKPAPTEGEKALINFLYLNYDDSFEIFYQPFLNGDLPDVIVMHKGGGVMIFEVKDWDLSNYTITSTGQWKINSNGAIRKDNPLRQVLKYKENLYNLHIDSLLSLKLKDYKYWYVVKCAVYFHCHTMEYAYTKCLGLEPTRKYKTFLEKNFSVLGYNSLSKGIMDRVFYDRWISRPNNYFSDDLYNRFARILRPSYHTIEQGIPINFTKEQQLLAKSEEGSRKRIKGVAGSGKTLVLAQRAVNAHIRTQGIVLILTYNITLKNYIHDRISSVRENFDWSYFHISNYHDFITSNMNNVGIEFDFLPKNENGQRGLIDQELFEKIADEKVYSNLNLFDGHIDELPKYDVMLIDEAQDYKENWINILLNNFVTEKAEIVAFADEKQNLYARDLDEMKMPKNPIQRGPWDGKLNKSYRLSAKVAMLVADFQKFFFSGKYDIDEKIETDAMRDLFADPYIEYHMIENPERKTIDNTKIAQYIFKQMNNHQLNSNDVTILSTRISMLRYLDATIKEVSKEKTNIMFETQEEYNQIMQMHFINSRPEDEIRKIRKNRKANFWMNRGTIKLSTIHSFKGWESPAVFLVIENDVAADNLIKLQDGATFPRKFADEMVYTGMTRCQNFLFVINLGNPLYDSFFVSELLVDKKCAISVDDI